VILTRLDQPPPDLTARTGWEVKPEGACRGDVCVPLRDPFSVTDMAERLRMPLVHEPGHRVWALGPESAGGRALSSAVLPEITLPDRNGRDFSLRSLRGTKVFMIAWASW
jgi:hypothetical protein